MWLTDELLLYYQRCQRQSFLDLYGDKSWRNPPSDFLLKLQRDSRVYRQSVLADRIYHQPSYPKQDWLSGAQATLELMQQGVDCIYQGVLLAPASYFRLRTEDRELENAQSSIPHSQLDEIILVSNPHLLVKQPGQSRFGNWIYLPTEIKFGRRPKPEYQVVAAFHAMVLASVQEIWPETAQLILRPQKVYSLDLNKWVPQMQAILETCIQTIVSPQAPELFISRQRCSFCQWHGHCYAVAKSQKHLSLLPGVSPNRYQYLQSLGITTVESLAATSCSQLELAFGEEVAAGLVRQAQSILENRAILIAQPEDNRASSVSISLAIPLEQRQEVPELVASSTPVKEAIANSNGEAIPFIHSSPFILHPASDPDILPTASVELYFDIEAEPELNLDYLLGVLVVDKLAQTQTFHPLLAEQLSEEEFIWQQFLDLVWAYPKAPIFHFSPYEADTVKRLAKLYKTPLSQVLPVLSRFVDVHNRVMGTVTLPVESYSLKSIASWMGFEWRDPQGNGSQSIYWFDQWLKTSDRACLEAIVRYNEDDCRATHHVKDWLVSFLQASHNLPGKPVS